MGNCTRRERTTTPIDECEVCHEQFCVVPRMAGDHDCRVLSPDGGHGSDATDDSTDEEPVAGTSEYDTAEPTVLYPEEVGNRAPDGDSSDGMPAAGDPSRRTSTRRSGSVDRSGRVASYHDERTTAR